jgi:hypothetical protein
MFKPIKPKHPNGTLHVKRKLYHSLTLNKSMPNNQLSKSQELKINYLIRWTFKLQINLENKPCHSTTYCVIGLTMESPSMKDETFMSFIGENAQNMKK